eukprot:CAMPEP_0206180246 /NCGR_PEP_ID=MMETSP1474-20131121/67835_1 /ASSEMBLY_ACC=CAM_ASM_001110 /TAXON_ID=97495 /ORGANISM="Imantonia sp., Strain RCC918" /LENGTH=147 /DNA_ID=CAMNT_0053593759 /DNA_START=2548 /DNA_END=2992 /DNA_ORIENTATION=+
MTNFFNSSPIADGNIVVTPFSTPCNIFNARLGTESSFFGDNILKGGERAPLLSFLDFIDGELTVGDFCFSTLGEPIFDEFEFEEVDSFDNFDVDFDADFLLSLLLSDFGDDDLLFDVVDLNLFLVSFSEGEEDSSFVIDIDDDVVDV